MILRVLLGLAIAYVIVVVLAWKFQARLALPGIRAPLPDPKSLGIALGEKIVVHTSDEELHGWFLPPNPAPPAGTTAPALMWFYGNGENIAGLSDVITRFQPPGTALVVLDYPGYGESTGSPSEDGLYRTADAAWRFLLNRAEIDRTRIAVYGRSIGSVPALYVASERPVAAIVVESPFTSIRAMARVHYPFLPPFIITMSMDNETRVRHVYAPLMVVHGTADEIAPVQMGKAIAEEGHARELLLIQGSGHNETYDKGGTQYREKVWGFLTPYLNPVPGR
jgi:fermentation-respiration switch protein FrsA (DUF1100 family)